MTLVITNAVSLGGVLLKWLRTIHFFSSLLLLHGQALFVSAASFWKTEENFSALKNVLRTESMLALQQKQKDTHINMNIPHNRKGRCE